MPNEHFVYTEKIVDFVKKVVELDDVKGLSDETILLLDEAVKEIYREGWLVGFREANQFVELRFKK